MAETAPVAAFKASERVVLLCLVEGCRHKVLARSSAAAVDSFQAHLEGPAHLIKRIGPDESHP